MRTTTAPRTASPSANDRRSGSWRRYRRLVSDLSADLGHEPSTADAQLIAQAAAIIVRCETLREQILDGVDIDDDNVVRLTNSAVRVLKELRGKRPANKAPNLKAYLANK